MPMFRVRIASEPIDPSLLQSQFKVDPQCTGALVTFTGHMRGEGIDALALEHYPGMTEQSIESTLASAARRWPLLAAEVVHRVGELTPGDPIVWLAVSARHRAAAFSGCEYIMDYLKVSAPLWKRELRGGRWHWVEARERDDQRARRWGHRGTGA